MNEILNTLYQLQQENRELTKKNTSLKSNQDSMYETNKVLLDRINNAIKYVETMVDSSMADQVYDIWYSNKEYLLSILKGE